MRIGIIIEKYNPSGGAERYTELLMNELDKRGHDVILFANRWKETNEVEFVRIPSPIKLAPLRIIMFALYAKRAIIKYQPQVVLSLERTIFQDILRAGGGSHKNWLQIRKQYCSYLKHLSFKINPLHLVLLYLERQAFNITNTRWIIANSQMVKQQIVESYDFPEDRIRVIYNGVNVENFTPKLDKEWRPFKIAFIGSGFERKGLSFAIQTLKLVPNDVELIVVGKGNINPYLKMAAKLGVSSRVKYKGFNLDVKEIFSQVHLLIHPTLYDPFANVTLEAMAAGIPVVTTPNNGGSEIIEQGLNGYVVSQTINVEEIAKAIRYFMDKERWIIAAQSARKTAERFTIQRNVLETLQLINEVMLLKS